MKPPIGKSKIINRCSIRSGTKGEVFSKKNSSNHIFGEFYLEFWRLLIGLKLTESANHKPPKLKKNLPKRQK